LNGQTVTATTYGHDGKVDEKTVTNTDGKGNPTGASNLTVDEQGQQTEVTTSTRDGETHETDRVVVGAATEGPEGYPEPISTKYDRPSLGL
jgi:Tfp pilus assembly protein PilV